MRRAIVPLAVMAGAVWIQPGAAGSGYEEAPHFDAAKVLSDASAKGPHHEVSKRVESSGFYQVFDLETEFGAMQAEGRTVLRLRLVEVDALVRLSEVSKTEVFAKAAGGAVLDVGKGVVVAVKDPGATVKGVGGGLKRMGVNLGRKSKRAVDDATTDSPGEPTEEGDASETAVKAADSVTGVNGAAREWAKKLGVDPYSTNPVLHAALVDIGRIDSAGSIAAKVVVPIPPVVNVTASVGGLVYGADPEQVRKSNEAGLAALGVPKDVAQRFFLNANYTLTHQIRLVTALQAVGARGCADYVAAAADASREREALFFVESAEMLSGLHAKTPVQAVLEDSRAMVASAGGVAVALLPFDWLYWTEDLERSAREIGARAKKELAATSLEVRAAGDVSAAARKGLAGAGWQVAPRFVAGLRVPPVD